MAGWALARCFLAEHSPAAVEVAAHNWPRPNTLTSFHKCFGALIFSFNNNQPTLKLYELWSF
jgi:hypothetical protein